MTDPLELIINRAANVFVSIFDNPHHPFRSLALVQSQSKSFSKPANSWLSLEAWQAGPEHEVHCADQLLCMRSDRQEGLDGQMQEQYIALRVASPHQNDHFMIQLERVRLEF